MSATSQNRWLNGLGVVAFGAIIGIVPWAYKNFFGAPTDLNEAAKYVVGTWSGGTSDGWWTRLDVHPDGSYAIYHAAASWPSWGNPHSGQWVIRSEKYNNTGKHFLLLHTAIDGAFAVKNGKLMVFNDDGDPQGFLTRGDHFPR